MDLATDPETRSLIKEGIKTTHCSGKKCNNSKFDFRNIQYYCENSGKFYCKLCSTKAWVFENKDSDIPERPVCRSDDTLSIIETAENNLRGAMATNEFSTLDKVYNSITENGTDIDVKLQHDAAVLHLKLEKELDIRNFIQSV